MPTAPNSRQIDMLRPANRLRSRRFELRMSAASGAECASPRASRPCQQLNGSPQLLRLAEYGYEKMCHRLLAQRRSPTIDPFGLQELFVSLLVDRLDFGE